MAYIDYAGSDFRRYTSANGWETDSMAQGAYGSYANGASQKGRCTFAGLSGFDLRRYKITGFVIYFTFSAAGYDAQKTLSLYASSTNDSARKLSNVKTAGNAYDGTTSVSFNSDADIAVLESAINAGNNYVTAYNGETSTSISTNYCRMVNGTLRIYFEEQSLAHIYDADTQSWKDAMMHVYTDGEWKQVGSVKKISSING